MPPRLTADIKERICRIARECDIRLAGDDAQHPPTGARHFARLCFALTHVDREWRRVGLRHAWHTVYVDDRLPHSAIAEMRAAHGRHTRKMWVQVTFGGIASHYRRYLHARDNSDIQPFCDLHRWPRLRDLEISYEHKCAFPALAAYIEPRLGAVRSLTITGRVPIDMRRSALGMRSAHLQEIHFRALPKSNDPLGPILAPNDPNLLLPVSSHVRAMTLTALIDTRTARQVLAQMRGQLEKLSVIGLSTAQLTAVGLLGPPVWARLCTLVVRVCASVAGDARARLDLDAVEFPRLERLLIAGQVHPSAGARDQPPLVSCRGMFAKVWPKLTHLCLPTLSSEDARAIGRTMPRLANICVRLAHVDRIQHSFDVRVLQQMLPSSVVVTICASKSTLPARDRTRANSCRPRPESSVNARNANASVVAVAVEGTDDSPPTFTASLFDYWKLV